jgi:hypothetical protein
MHKPSVSFIIKGIHGVQACRFYAILTAGLRATNPGSRYRRFVTKSETISQLATPEGKRVDALQSRI